MPKNASKWLKSVQKLRKVSKMRDFIVLVLLSLVFEVDESGFARDKVPCFKTHDVLSARIDAQKRTDDTFKDTKKNV